MFDADGGTEVDPDFIGGFFGLREFFGFYDGSGTNFDFFKILVINGGIHRALNQVNMLFVRKFQRSYRANEYDDDYDRECGDELVGGVKPHAVFVD